MDKIRDQMRADTQPGEGEEERRGKSRDARTRSFLSLSSSDLQTRACSLNSCVRHSVSRTRYLPAEVTRHKRRQKEESRNPRQTRHEEEQARG